jgi:hypothetical protein
MGNRVGTPSADGSLCIRWPVKLPLFSHIFLLIVPIGPGRASSPALLPVGLLIQIFICANTHTKRVSFAAAL